MLVAQSNACNVCAVSFSTIPVKDCCLDHDHVTGRIRSLLCRDCNLMLGYARDNPSHCANAASYLIAYQK